MKHNSFHLPVALVIVLGTMLSSQISLAQEETINLVIGQQRVLKLPGVTRIAIGNPSVADVKVTGGSDILITATGEGVTELPVWRGTRVSTFAITGSKVDIKKLHREVMRLLGKREGLSARVSGDRIYIEGKALTLEDIERAEEVTELYKQVRSLVKLDPSAHALIAEQINKVLASAGLGNARASVVGSTVFLEGTVDNEGDLKKAQILVKNISKNIESLLRVGPSKMVEAEVEFVELSLNSSDKIGIEWPTSFIAGGSGAWTGTKALKGQDPTTSGLSANAALSEVSIGVHLQFSDGATRVLARPTLVPASGQKAEFLVGGEIPIAIMTDNQIQIQYKEFGIRLNLKPIVDVNSIQNEILAEVSQVDRSLSVLGIPGFSTRRVKTTVTVKDGETIIMGGLLQRTEQKDVSKLALLGHIPIIGELFKSRNFTEGKTDLVIFITPRLIDPLSDRITKAIMSMTKRYKLGSDEVGFSIFD